MGWRYVAGVLTAFSICLPFVVPQGVTIAGLFLVAGQWLCRVAGKWRRVFVYHPGEKTPKKAGRDSDHDWRKTNGKRRNGGIFVCAGFAGHFIGLQAKS